jgi:hypothetical protein
MTTSTYREMARGLEAVSPSGPMTLAAAIMALADAEGRPVIPAEIAQMPPIPEGTTRAEYAQILRAN